MVDFIPVDHDPFSSGDGQAVNFVPIDHNPFAESPSASDAFLKKADNMVTFGLTKPISAAGIAAIEAARGKGSFGDVYDKVMAQQNAEEDAAAEQHPYAAGAGNAVGALSSFALAPASAGAQTVSKTKQLMNSSLWNAATGAAIGGINGAGNAQGDASDRLDAGVNGAVSGGIVGAVLPSALTGVAKVGSTLLAPIKTAMTPAVDRAIGKIAQNIGRDKLSPDEIAANLQGMGSNASLSDAAGENLIGLGGTIARSPGEGRSIANEFIQNRAAGAPTRINSAIDVGLGNGDYHASIDNLINQRQEAAQPFYKQAFAENQSVQHPDIDRVLLTPAGKIALKDAAVKMQNDMSLMGVNDSELMEQAKLTGQYQPGDGGIASGLKMRTLDYVKRSLDDQIGTAIRGGQNDNARILQSLKSKLVRGMDAADSTASKDSPGFYAKARAAYSEPSQSLDALDLGNKFINNDPTANIATIKDLSPQDQAFFRIGAARALKDKVNAAPDGADAAKRIFGSPDKRATLKSVFPSEDAFNDFQKQVGNEMLFAKNKQTMIGNSPTQSRQADAADAGITPGDILEAAGGNFKGLALNALRGTLGRLQGITPEVSQELGNRLFSSNPVQNAATIKALNEYMQNNGARALNLGLPTIIANQGAAFAGRAASGN